MRNAYKILGRKSERERPPGRMDLFGSGQDVMDATEASVCSRARNFLTASVLISFSRRTVS
jgi:hypothetical protein